MGVNMKRPVLLLACVGLAAPAAAQVTARAYLPWHITMPIRAGDRHAHACGGGSADSSWGRSDRRRRGAGQRRVYVINPDSDTVSVIDAHSATVVGPPIPVGDLPDDIEITPDGRKVYVVNAADPETVSVIDTATGAVTATITIDGAAGVAASPNGQRVYVTSWTADAIVVIDTATDTVVGSPIPAGRTPFDIAVTPDGTRAYVSGWDGVTAVNLLGGLVLASIPVPVIAWGVTATRDGSTILVAHVWTSSVSVIDVATNTTRPPPISVVLGGAAGIAQLPGRQTAYVAGWGAGLVTILDLTSLAPIGTIPLAAGQWTTGRFVGPNIITTTCADCGALTLSGDDPSSRPSASSAS